MLSQHYWACPLLLFVALTQSVFGTEVFGKPKSMAELPNIVLVVADDLGYGELSCQGSRDIQTPHIDALAETGVRCTQAYVAAPNCSPSRAGLLTGMYPTRFGYEFNPIGARNEDDSIGLPANVTTLPETLQSIGYTTGLVGKWHLGGHAKYHPLRHGFDYFFGFTHEGHYYEPHPWSKTQLMLRRKQLPLVDGSLFRVNDRLHYSTHMPHDEPDYDANNPIVRNGQPVVEPEYFTDAIARESVEFIQQYQDAPFFLMVAFNAVHSPLQAKQETFDRFSQIDNLQRRIFAAMLSDMDSAVGRIVDELDQQKLRDRTLVIFLSDNGGPTQELTSSNAPLRGGKSDMYEGGIRVPCIWNWPKGISSQFVLDDVVSSLDIFPTILELVGKESPAHLDGRSIIPELREEIAGSDRELYWRQGNRAALRQGPWKMVNQVGSSDRQWELYNIADDLAESKNLADEHPEVFQRLIDRWQELDSEMAQPLFSRW